MRRLRQTDRIAHHVHDETDIPNAAMKPDDRHSPADDNVESTSGSVDPGVARVESLFAEIGVAAELGNNALCHRLALQALELATAIDWKLGIARSLLLIGNYASSGEESARAFESSMALSRASAFARLELSAMCNMGHRRRIERDFRGSIEILQQTLALERAFPAPELRAQALVDLSDAYMSLGEYAAAHAQSADAIQLCDELNLRPQASMLLRHVAEHHYRSHRFAEALANAQLAVERVADPERFPGFRAEALAQCARICIELCDPGKARAYAEQAISIIDRAPEAFRLARTREDLELTIMQCLIREDQTGDARRFLASTMARTDERDDRDWFDLYLIACQIELAAAELDASEQWLLRAQEVAARLNNPVAFNAVELHWVHILQKRGRCVDAIDHYSKAFAYERQIIDDNAAERFRVLEVQRDRIRIEKEREIERLRVEHLQQQLDARQRELTAHALALSRQVELLDRFRTDIRTALEQADRAETAIRSIREKLKELPCETIDWVRFEAAFRDVHPTFIADLAARHPQLTKMQTRICTLVRLNIPARDIAQMLCLSERNIEGHRYRIRKALRLEKGQDLSDSLALI